MAEKDWMGRRVRKSCDRRNGKNWKSCRVSGSEVEEWNRVVD